MRLIKDAKPEEALSLLNRLNDDALAATLDPVTAMQTRGYRDALKAHE